MRILALWLCTVGVLCGEVVVRIETEAGVMDAVLDEQRAPITTANFLKHVDAGYYTGGQFHRTVRSKPDNQPQSPVKIDVVQAGVRGEGKLETIRLERTRDTGLRHTDGALSMPRGAEPDSGSSGFFICIGEQKELDFGGKRNPDGQGFAVFGRVVKGMDVARKIHRAPAGPSEAKESVAAGDQKLTPAIRILRITRVGK